MRTSQRCVLPRAWFESCWHDARQDSGLRNFSPLVAKRGCHTKVHQTLHEVWLSYPKGRWLLVTCLACQGGMCWKCDTHLHLADSGVIGRHCGKCNNRYVRTNRCRLYTYLCMPLLLPLMVLYAVATIAISILTCCFCGFFCFSLESGEGQFRRGMWWISLVIGFPFVFLMDLCDVNLPFMDELFPDPYTVNEIPPMQLSGTINDATA